jgi:predicted lipid-binding transport protein (Tim44 family)
LQHAWSLGRFDEVRRGMSDGVLRRFSTQVALNRLWDKRNVTADVLVKDVAVVGVESDDEFDSIHLRFSASARDCDVRAEMSDAEAASRAARAPASSFVETWSFVRRLNPESRGGKLSEGKCPSCGGRSLFLGEGGYVTCSWIECADPTAITDLIEGSAS